MTPTRSRPPMPPGTSRNPPVGTFQRTYLKEGVVSTGPSGRHPSRVDDTLLRADEGILVLDGDGADARLAADRGDEFPPPGSLATVAHNREVPAEGGWMHRPPVIEQPVASQVCLGEPDVLAVAVARPVADSGDDGDGVHAHPEELGGGDVRGDRLAESGQPVEGLQVVDGRAWMQLEADQELRVLGCRKLRDRRPVGGDPALPLRLVDGLEVRQPSPTGEVRRPVA